MGGLDLTQTICSEARSRADPIVGDLTQSRQLQVGRGLEIALSLVSLLRLFMIFHFRSPGDSFVMSVREARSEGVEAAGGGGVAVLAACAVCFLANLLRLRSQGP